MDSWLRRYDTRTLVSELETALSNMEEVLALGQEAGETRTVTYRELKKRRAARVGGLHFRPSG